MRLEPLNLFLALVGCIYDWMLSRKWKKILKSLTPVFFLLAVAGLAVWGSRLSREKLAAHYLELGNAEVAKWDSQWSTVDSKKPADSTPDATKKTESQAGASTSGAKAEGESNGGSKDTGAATATASAADASTDAKAGEEPKSEKLSRFAEVLFRRVQQLRSGDQLSVFYVAMSLAQRDSVQQARSLLRRIAPDDREGFLPAHAWLASLYLSNPAALAESRETFAAATHHAKVAMRWDRASPQLLTKIGEFMDHFNNQETAVQALKLAADKDPSVSLMLGKLSRKTGNKLLAEQSYARSESTFAERVRKAPGSEADRLLLAETYANQLKFDQAEATIREGLAIKESQQLVRALSTLYLERYRSTRELKEGQFKADVQMLDQAFRIDPTNPAIAEEFVILGALGGEQPAELHKQLEDMLAEGTATPTTHAWIAELYLVKNEYEKAIPHMEQIVLRLPSAVNYLNNLAFVLAQVRPDRLEDALNYADEAVKLKPRDADFHDTRGVVLSALGRNREAIAEFEHAVELLPTRIEFHERAAKAYRAEGNPTLAAVHEQKIVKIVAQQEAEQQQQAKQAKAPSDGENAPQPNDDKKSAEVAKPSAPEKPHDPEKSSEPEQLDQTEKPGEVEKPSDGKDASQANDASSSLEMPTPDARNPAKDNSAR